VSHFIPLFACAAYKLFEQFDTVGMSKPLRGQKCPQRHLHWQFLKTFFHGVHVEIVGGGDNPFILATGCVGGSMGRGREIRIMKTKIAAIGTNWHGAWTFEQLMALVA
jgi:hypothetical protein